jgi:hypothetical protein
MTASMTSPPRVNPTTGETTIGMITFCTIPPHSTTPSVANRVAPTSPPNSACDEEEGIPKYQVSRFQQIAPTTPAKTTPRLARPVGRSTSPLPTVLATFSPRWVPAKLPSAATASATRGVSARVETEVAIAFAASWNPLV